MNAISKYNRIYVKRNAVLALICAIIVFIPIFIMSLVYDVLPYDLFIAFVPFGLALLCVLISLFPTIRFHRMIEEQEKQYGILFSDDGIEHLETTLYLSNHWLIWAGSSAFYREHILSIRVRAEHGQSGTSNRVIVTTKDGKRYCIWCLHSSSIKEIKSWLKKNLKDIKRLVVAEIINEWDPIGLFPGAPDDEYHSEIEQIQLALEMSDDSKQIAEEIWSVFAKSFGTDVFQKTKEECKQIAERLLDRFPQM